ncbi:putative mannosyltransferase-like protein [Trypanosoma rangeli]|uniref:Putative mannosyltransferase-like protein n=1 Tax=Trypanosoma rangeli TaxID=5698 RepID=A0A3R7RH60_TRYRA|nr:putative mannosyltransferase-like protein [Trypanosoma rangeli]RNF02624.1 putative mannosyltransferase-like protein [Trypanosoma rangeli]|eukprot:RNF02624.1 putative mannosyltransferase-like protein [Trypanosoma rangeli]
MKARRFRPRAAGGRTKVRRKLRLVLALLFFLLCLFLLQRLLWRDSVININSALFFVPAGGNTNTLTVVVTELQSAYSGVTAAEAGPRLEQALQRRAWCTSASPTQSVALVLIFYALLETPRWSRNLPVQCVACGKNDPWHVWTVDLAGLQTRETLDVAPCVTEAHIIFAHKAEKVTKLNHGVDPAMVRAALAVVPRTDYFLLMADFVVPTGDDFMQKMLLPLKRNDGRVAAVQCTLLQKRKERTRNMSGNVGGFSLSDHSIVDRGVFVGLGVMKGKRLLLPYLTRRFNGNPATDGRVSEPEVVDAVSSFCTLYHRAAFDAVGGFRELTPGSVPSASSAPDIAGWDQSIRLQEKYTWWQVLSSAALGVLDSDVTLPHLVSTLLRKPAFPATDRWGKNNFETLQRLHNRRFGTPHRSRDVSFFDNEKPLAPLIFFARDYSCSCCGLMREVTGYLRPLAERYGVSILTPVWYGFCSSAVGSELAMLELTDELHVERFFSPLPHSPVWRAAYEARRKIVVMHLRAHTYKRVHATVPHKMDYFIGRSLSEFSRIPHSWVHGMQYYANEVWSTGEFFSAVYRRAGVAAEKIHVIPEALNVHSYNPRDCDTLTFPMPLRRSYTNLPELSPEEQRRRFRFLTVMKWEGRKGWDILLKAYWQAFGPTSPLHNHVSLYMKVKWVKAYSGNAGDNNIHELIANWASKNLPGFTSMKDFPHIVFLSGEGYVSERLLRQMYCSVDAFVFPTRGEGWGLPATEAMAMGVPILVTNWGGTTTFMSSNATFAIAVDGLEDAPDGLGYDTFPGNKWAIPSVQSAADTMRYVVENPAHARAVGMRGRQLIKEHFSEEAIADRFDSRFAAVTRMLVFGR